MIKRLLFAVVSDPSSRAVNAYPGFQRAVSRKTIALARPTFGKSEHSLCAAIALLANDVRILVALTNAVVNVACVHVCSSQRITHTCCIVMRYGIGIGIGGCTKSYSNHELTQTSIRIRYVIKSRCAFITSSSDHVIFAYASTSTWITLFAHAPLFRAVTACRNSYFSAKSLMTVKL